MLEDKIDKVANGIKSGIGWIRENKGRIITGVLVGAGTIVGGGIIAAIAKKDQVDDDYLCLEETDYEIEDSDWEPDDEDSEIETEVEVTVEE